MMVLCAHRKMRELAEKAEQLSLTRVQENLETLHEPGMNAGDTMHREWSEMRKHEHNPFATFEDMWSVCGKAPMYHASTMPGTPEDSTAHLTSLRPSAHAYSDSDSDGDGDA